LDSYENPVVFSGMMGSLDCLSSSEARLFYEREIFLQAMREQIEEA
jgi:hypothetical protein